MSIPRYTSSKLLLDSVPGTPPDVRPVKWVDHIFIPGMTHEYYTLVEIQLDDFPITETLLSHSHTIQDSQITSITLDLTSDYGQHTKHLREGIHNQWSETYTSIYYSYRISRRESPIPFLPPNPAQIQRALAFHQGVGAMANGTDLRTQLLLDTPQYAQTQRENTLAIDRASLAGDCTYHYVTDIPSSVKSDPAGLFVVSHSKVHGRGPWVVSTEGDWRVIAPVLAPLVAHVSSTPVQWLASYEVRASDKEGAHDVAVGGGFWPNLRSRLLPMLKRARTSVTIEPRIPSGETAPLIDKVHLYQRSVMNTRAPKTEKALRTFLTMIANPPPGVLPAWENVRRVDLWPERIHCLEKRMDERMCVIRMKQYAGDMICVTNANAMTRIPGEIGKVREMGILAMGMREEKKGVVDAIDELDGEEDEDEEDYAPPLPGAMDWADLSTDPRLDRHLASAADALIAQRFHSSLPAMIKRNDTVQMPLVRRRLDHFMTTHSLTKSFVIRRVSNGETSTSGKGQTEGGGTTNISLGFQLLAVLNSFPTGTTPITLDHVSISTDVSPVLDEIRKHHHTLFGVSSTCRVARSLKGLEQIQQLCIERHNVIVALYFPPDDLRQLVACENELITPAIRAQLAPVWEMGVREPSYPSYCPTVIAGSPLQPDVKDVLQKGARRSEAFIQSLLYGSFQADHRIEIQPIPHGGKWADKLQQGVKVELARILPEWKGEVIWHIFEGQYATRCACKIGKCAENCRCACRECKEVLRAACRHSKGEEVVQCPCSCCRH